jgi:lysophospholipase L1-like esterase
VSLISGLAGIVSCGGLGPTALDRFDYNILNQQGVKWLIILEGVNDLGGTRDPDDASKRTEELIAAYQVMIDKAHANGIKVYGATILPFESRSTTNLSVSRPGKK